VGVEVEEVTVSLWKVLLAWKLERSQVSADFGGFSDSSRAKSSGGSSMSLKACWSWLAENGISKEY
jgi:hypothetical protein